LISQSVSLKYLGVKCPTGFDSCPTCFNFNGQTCTYGAFSHGMNYQPRRDFGTSGIEIEQELLDAREMRKTVLDEMNRRAR
jgi:hypothetical protein